MNIGILTFHKTDNYGAMLQAYALSAYLENKRHTVCFIDYCPEYVYKKLFNKKTFTGKCKDQIKHIVCKSIFDEKNHKFKSFVKKYFKLMPVDIVSDLDMVFIGSDQVWAPRLTNYDSYYLGGRINNKKIVSYAASCGNVSNLDDRTKSLYIQYLSKLKYISVRENSARKILNDLLERDCYLNIDPTLLVDNSLFENIQILPNKKSYIFVYDATNPDVLEFAKKLAAKLNKEVVALSCDIAIKNKDVLIQSASVEEFLGYVANSDIVVSTSFHGCALAISYHKNLYCINTGAIASRSKELLETLSISDRYVNIDDDIDPTPIDYVKLDVILNKLKVSSMQYISMCLNN